jgi:hypothetical protein
MACQLYELKDCCTSFGLKYNDTGNLDFERWQPLDIFSAVHIIFLLAYALIKRKRNFPHI